jgi:hypothetical protein
VTFDTGGLFSGLFPTRLTAPVAGKYQITGQALVTIGGLGGPETLLFLQLDGVTRIAASIGAATTVTPSYRQVTTLYDLAAGQYVELFANQVGGVAGTILANTDDSPDLMMVRVDS